MTIMDGKSLSDRIKDELKCEIEGNKSIPVLSVISIGEDGPSRVYINNKKKACEQVGIGFMHIHFDEDVKESEVISKIEELNCDSNVNGILLQLPIPNHLDSRVLLNKISYLKDVDGLSDISIGKSMFDSAMFIPCTAKGIIEILDYYKIDLKSKNVVIVGRSLLVGKPILQECLKRDATITICHSKTKSLSSFTKNADVLIVAVGKKYLIDKSMIKDDVVIIDVGINVEDGKLYGDVNPNVEDKCSYKTPVPKGVGPMTVAMLLKNTVIAYNKQNGK